MAYFGSGNGGAMDYGEYVAPRSADEAPGRRRNKIAGLFRAANEVRQSYFSGDGSGAKEHDSILDGPGAFADAAVVRSGNEEMILFPSYARRHVKLQTENMPGSNVSEQEFWRREWEKHQNDRAVVDVDVRGWFYSPHRGQHTRRQRLLIGIARQLSGVPAPPAGASSESSQSSRLSSRVPSPNRPSTRQEEDLISFEADHILKRGEAEARKAGRGHYSENPNKGDDTDSLYGGESRDASPVRGSRLSTYSNASMSPPVSPTIAPLQSRASWTSVSKMSQAELVAANGHLLHRLKPFMHTGLPNTPITAMFYSDHASRQLTVYTDDSGHFSFHASLEFVPTGVKVVAGEDLSATEEIHVTSPKGVSLISDIDDTIKHSGISNGAREIFRNAFIRDLSDMTIDGVREWYNTLHDMGVKLHYVSNSPWQMYPILATYFKLAYLPKGSFHLKQYSGALAGIFEPVAERKKSSLNKIMRDFPERRFILVGDSGEADLEVYTDVALDHPGRILGVFIRDVTSSVKTGYFDPSTTPTGSGKHSRDHSRNHSGDALAMSKRLSRPEDIRNDDADLQAAITASLTTMEEETRRARRSINPDAPRPAEFDGSHDRMSRPALPQRPQTNSRVYPDSRMSTSPQEESLIDLGEEHVPPKPWLQPPAPRRSSTGLKASPSSIDSSHKSTPSPPPKPRALRSVSPGLRNGNAAEGAANKTAPPRPRKPSSAVSQPPPLNLDGAHSPTPTNQAQHPAVQIQTQPPQPSPLSQVTQHSATDLLRRPPLPTRPKSFQKISGSGGPAWYPQNTTPMTSQPRPPSSSGPTLELPRPMSSVTPSRSVENLRRLSAAPGQTTAPPPPPPRRNFTASTPFSTSSRVGTSYNRNSGNGFNDDGGGSAPSTPGDAGLSRKEILWQQRLQKAKNVLEPQGVTVRTWRVGSDVADVCVKLAEQEMRRIEREERATQRGG